MNEPVAAQTTAAGRPTRLTGSTGTYQVARILGEWQAPGEGRLYRMQGRDVPDELLSYIAPGHRENINFFGFISVGVEAELAKLIEGWRPLRPTTVTDAGTTFMLHP
ncbi:hypothetical protein [Actinomadura sp. NTSP31]|uniref:hypothetical protein n=1 Tax=Actinomadura sp. NTSP31 TaxID=1735447 RepID=UPI0035BF5E50